MLHVDFDPARLQGDNLAWWQQWSAKADNATQATRASMSVDGSPKLQASIWSELRSWLLKHVFSGKCAYCEFNFVPGYYGDAEHYRPKARVTVNQNGRLEVVTRRGQPHPGYYWVAYDWSNLLPSCAVCNGPQGKQNQFPVAATHVFDPEDGPDSESLDKIEQPLLLHPYKDDPATHLKFGRFGTIAERDGSRRGRESIKVYGLSRKVLNEARTQRQEEARAAFALALVDYVQHGIRVWENEKMKCYTGPNAPFSKAVSDYIAIYIREELIPEL